MGNRWGLEHALTIVEAGPTEQVLTSPQDSYTIRLLQSVPSSDTGWLTAKR